MTRSFYENDRRYTKAREMRMARDTVTGRLYCRTAICTSASIATGLDTVKVSMCSKTVPGITAIGGTDANMVKGSFGTLTERDTKVRRRKNVCTKIGSESDSRKSDYMLDDTRASTCVYLYNYFYIARQKSKEKRACRELECEPSACESRDKSVRFSTKIRNFSESSALLLTGKKNTRFFYYNKNLYRNVTL